MRIIMESGALYSMSLVAILAAYPSETNVAYILTDMVHPLNIETIIIILTSSQIAQIIPITFFLIIVRTTMLRFNDRTTQGLFMRTGTPDRFFVTRPTTVHIDRMAVVDSDGGKSPELSSSHADAVEDTYI